MNIVYGPICLILQIFQFLRIYREKALLPALKRLNNIMINKFIITTTNFLQAIWLTDIMVFEQKDIS